MSIIKVIHVLRTHNKKHDLNVWPQGLQFSLRVMRLIMTGTHWEMLLKSTEVLAQKHSYWLCCYYKSTVFFRYSLRNVRTDVFLTTVRFDRTIKVILSFFQTHNISGVQKQKSALADIVGGEVILE